MASRKSARITAMVETAVMATTQLEKEKLEQSSEDKQVNVNEKTTKKAQGRKKQKTSNEKDTANDNAIADQLNRSRIKGKRENSKFMKDIPVDVLLEIFSYLGPEDLLHLSRVSKSLHDLLISDDLTFLWKLTYKDVLIVGRRYHTWYQPPPCPDETNIVFYTNYLYGRHCQFCASPYGRIYHESAFIRLCSKCADNSFLSLNKVDPSVRQLCNQWTPRRYTDKMVLKVEYSLRLKEFKHAQKEKRAKSYVTERERIVYDRIIIARHLAEWRKEMQQIQLHKLRAIRKKREKDIKTKLELEGYKADVGMIRSDRIPHLRKSHELTDSEWSYIRIDILNFFQDIRDNLALSNMRIGLQNRISQLEWFIYRWENCPTAWWIASSEPIASFMKNGLPERIPEKDIEKLEPQLRSLITSWKEETDCYLATLIPQPSGKGKKKDSHNSKTSALELATTFFKCYWCTEPISYPRILMHGCLLKAVKLQEEAEGEEDDESDSDMEDFEEDMVVDARGPQVLRPPKEVTPDMAFTMVSDHYSLGMCAGKEGVSYDEEASNFARDIITACGQDPMTVTYAAMEKMHARLECLRCSQAMQAKQKAKQVRLVMKWNMALVHELEEHYGESPSSGPAWRKIDSLQDLAKVKDAETNVRKLKKYQKSLTCNYCSWSTNSLQQRLCHLSYVHNIYFVKDSEDTVFDHFSPPVDTPIKVLYPAFKI